MKIKKDQIHTYQILLMPEEEGGYTVLVPQLPGCISYGRTVEVAKEKVREAIELYLEDFADSDDALPSIETDAALITTVQVKVPAQV